MSRIEKIGNATLYLGDCREILPTLPKVDLVLTDPPYGIGRDKGMGGGGFDSTGTWKRKPKKYEGDWDDVAPDGLLIDAAVSIGELAVVWGGNYFNLQRENGKWLVWNKQQVMPSFSDAELAWTTFSGSSVKMLNLHCNKARMEVGQHPTQKPVALMEWCINLAPKTTSTVADPFMGSGTTGVACANLCKTFIGIEREPKYFDIACQRIENAYRQERLFT